MSTSPVTCPPGSAAKTKQNFDRVEKEADDLDTMENSLSAYHMENRATAARLESLETCMQAQQAVQVGMQKQQADFLE